MKIYCFQCNEDHGGNDYPTENGIALAHNEEEAWQLFYEKYEGWRPNFDFFKQGFKIEKVLDTSKPVSWRGECTN